MSKQNDIFTALIVDIVNAKIKKTDYVWDKQD